MQTSGYNATTTPPRRLSSSAPSPMPTTHPHSFPPTPYVPSIITHGNTIPYPSEVSPPLTPTSPSNSSPLKATPPPSASTTSALRNASPPMSPSPPSHKTPSPSLGTLSALTPSFANTAPWASRQEQVPSSHYPPHLLSSPAFLTEQNTSSPSHPSADATPTVPPTSLVAEAVAVRATPQAVAIAAIAGAGTGTMRISNAVGAGGLGIITPGTISHPLPANLSHHPSSTPSAHNQLSSSLPTVKALKSTTPLHGHVHGDALADKHQATPPSPPPTHTQAPILSFSTPRLGVPITQPLRP